MTVTVEQVRNYAQLPPAPAVTDETVQLYIDGAHLIVTEDLASSGYSEERLEMIELNLAAHFATISAERGGLTYMQIGQAAERYQLGPEGMFGLSTTRFGQLVLSLDPLGLLAPLATPSLKAQFKVYG